MRRIFTSFILIAALDFINCIQQAAFLLVSF